MSTPDAAARAMACPTCGRDFDDRCPRSTGEPWDPTYPDADSKDEAADVVGRLAGWQTPPDWMDPSVVRLAVRNAARRCHPDTGGSNDAWLELQAAARVLGVTL